MFGVGTIQLTCLKSIEETHNDWKPCFKAFCESEHGSVAFHTLRDRLFRLRENAYRLRTNGYTFRVWAPTVLNQVVLLDGRTFSVHPMFRAIGRSANFDIICEKTPPYAVSYIQIDFIDYLGRTDESERWLQAILSLGGAYGVPTRMYDHAFLCDPTDGPYVPLTLCSFLNDPEYGVAYPMRWGFRQLSPAELRTSETIEALVQWAAKHRVQLAHFIQTNGEINWSRRAEFGEFLVQHLPNRIRVLCERIHQTQYTKYPNERRCVSFEQVRGI